MNEKKSRVTIRTKEEKKKSDQGDFANGRLKSQKWSTIFQEVRNLEKVANTKNRGGPLYKATH